MAANEAPKVSAPPGNVKLTDANMTITNDNPVEITVLVQNNVDMKVVFPSPVNLSMFASAEHYVEASTWSIHQSHFDVVFNSSGDQMTVNIGRGIYSTDVTPESFADGKEGIILAPTNPFDASGSTIDYAFLFFAGPGIIHTLINSAIQANLPAIIHYINDKTLTIKITDTSHLIINKLFLDSSSVTCTYAAARPESPGDETLWRVNVILRVGKGAAEGILHLNGGDYTINLSVADCLLYIQVRLDTTMQKKPEVMALQCSLGDYSLSGTLVDYLKSISAAITLIYDLGATAYRVAGAVNTPFNNYAITAINNAISNIPISSIPGPFRGLGPANTPSMPSQPHKAATASSHPLTGDLSTWMSSDEIQAKTLGKLKLPGTHDSGTFKLDPILSQISYPNIQFLWYLSSDKAPTNDVWPIPKTPSADTPDYLGSDLYNFVLGSAVPSISRTQDTTILKQLQGGIRHFDFRVYFDTRDNHFYVQHALRGPRFDDILDDISTFIKNNSTSGELIFAVISHTNLNDHPDQIPTLLTLVNRYIDPKNLYYQATPAGQSRFDFQSLANTTVKSITSGAPKVMFINGDKDYAYPDTITNTCGYAGRDWDGETYTVACLSAKEGKALQDNTQPLWAVGWVLGANTPTIIQNIFWLLIGVEKWALQDIAAQANGSLLGFLDQHGGKDGNFNLVTVDWFETGVADGVAKLVIDMN